MADGLASASADEPVAAGEATLSPAKMDGDIVAEIAVVGAGPTGMAAALAFAAAGIDTVLIGPPTGADPRTTALLGASADVLREIGVWQHVEAASTPLETMRLIDDTGRLVRAPEVTFHAGELDLDAFGWNVANEALNEGFATAVAAASSLLHRPVTADGFEIDAAGVTVKTAKGNVRARLLVAADGARSPAREAAGLDVISWSYPQAAFVTTLSHVRSHGLASTEFHTTTGPFTLVPLAGRRSSLVWVERPERANALAALADGVLSREIERRAHSILGAMQVDGPRGVLPLSTHVARRFAGNRVALIGEAGHRIPPIGAQGLNLGLRDVRSLAALVSEETRRNGDPGKAGVLDAYDRARRTDVAGRAVGVDLLNRSLLSDFLPLQLARSVGLYAAAEFPPLRRLLMRGGLGQGALPAGRPRRPLVASGGF